MPLVLRSVKGSNLTPNEADGNFTFLDGRITVLEGLPMGVGIDSVDITGGNQLNFHLSDSSVETVTLPTAQWRPMGEWQASFPYQVMDLVTVNGSLYQVMVAHTSATAFDPGEQISSQDVYKFIISYQPIGGFDRTSATFTPALEDANTYNRMTNASGCTVTIDPAVLFLPWTELTFRDESSDTGAFVSFAVLSPGSINSIPGHLDQTDGSGSTVTLKKVGDTDAWDIMGRVAPI